MVLNEHVEKMRFALPKVRVTRWGIAEATLAHFTFDTWVNRLLIEHIPLHEAYEIVERDLLHHGDAGVPDRPWCGAGMDAISRTERHWDQSFKNGPHQNHRCGYQLENGIAGERAFIPGALGRANLSHQHRRQGRRNFC